MNKYLSRYPSGAPCSTGDSLDKVVATLGNNILHDNLPVGDRTKFFTTITALIEIKLSTLKTPRAPRTPERRERQNAKRPSCFLQTSKYFIFFSILSEKYLTSGQCYQGNIFLLALPFSSYYAAIPGWSLVCHRSTIQNKAIVAQYMFIVSICFLRWIS
jgi:hypothetical protein